MKKELLMMGEQLMAVFQLSGIIVVLILAFVFQIVLHELPCPLCLLQRVGFICITMGFLMNLRFGSRPSHYSIVLLSALFTSFVALRQMALHIIPGSGAYGDALFGFHLYTWSFFISMAIVIVTAIILGFNRQYITQYQIGIKWRYLTHTLFAITAIVILANIVSVVLECGFKTCPDDPVKYRLLSTKTTVKYTYTFGRVAPPTESHQ